jgi:large subunit ribosomal protein L22
VLKAIKGKPVAEAEAMLRFMPGKGAELALKVLRSAVANAVENNDADEELLYVKNAYADESATLKRIKYRAYGRADRISKRTHHLTIIVDELEVEGEEAPKRKEKPKAKAAEPAEAKVEQAEKPEKAEAKAEQAEAQAAEAEDESKVKAEAVAESAEEPEQESADASEESSEAEAESSNDEEGA